MDVQQLKDLLVTHFKSNKITVESDDNVHFSAEIISEQFENLSKIKRQQLVYAALGNKIQTGEIHALSLKTRAPSEV